jgi:hypothetical protein
LLFACACLPVPHAFFRNPSLLMLISVVI